MERLTLEELKNIGQNYVITSRLGGKQMTSKILNELSQYKSIEEQLGIDLITLFKALVGGVWTKGGYYDENIRRKANFC